MHSIEHNSIHEPPPSPLLLLFAAATVVASMAPMGVPLIIAPRSGFAIGTAILFVWSVCCVLGTLYSPNIGVRLGIPTTVSAILAICTLVLIVSAGLLLIPALVCWSILAIHQLRRVEMPHLPRDIVVMSLGLIFCLPLAGIVTFVVVELKH